MGDPLKPFGQFRDTGTRQTAGSLPSSLRVLIVEDSTEDCELILHEMRRAGFAVEYRRVETQQELTETLRTFTPDVILSDFTMPQFKGTDALFITRSLVPETPFIFVSGTIGEERAAEAMKLGATDYLLKDHLQRFVPVLKRALHEAQERARHRRAQGALLESEERFRAFMRNLPGRASITDVEGRYTYVNENWLIAFGKKPAEVLGHTHGEVWPPERAANLNLIHREVVETGEAVRRVFPVGFGASARWWLAHHFPIPDAHGKTAMVGAVAIDITEQKLQEEKIARLSRIYAVLSGINSVIVRVRERQTLFDEACRIAVEHGGFGIAWIGVLNPESLEVTPVAWGGVDAQSDPPSPNTARPDVPLGQGLVGRAIRGRRTTFTNDLAAEPGGGGERREEALRRGYRSAIVLPLEVEGEVVGNLSLFARELNFFTDDEVKLLTELAGDISFALEHISKHEKLNYLAYYDGLTDLPNRMLFYERLNHELHAASHEGKKVALLLADIKRLRFINESFGRQTGDALLREIAGRLKKIWPDPDNVARIAADCFAGILPNVKEAADVAHLIERSVTTTFAEPFAIEDKELSVSLTAGIAIFPGDGEHAETLFRNAEAALNKAKKFGERYLFYQPAMNATVGDTLRLESKMRRALEKEQFVLHYQPKLSFRGESISGAEALIRWDDPEAGLVFPAQFVPLLEETAMILDAGRWAMRKALGDHREWSERGLKLPRIAVNVSAIQLRQRDFVEGVRSAIEACGTSAHALELEVTESMIMEDVEDTIAKLRALRNAGVNIAIDDFGTGYSSLGYLAKLPVNTLKIDRSFIMTMTDDADSMSIVSTIISLAHSLNLEVVAEGVETDEQSRVLRLLRCDQIQGYLVGKPMPFDELAGLLRQNFS